jgi:hypothetical protein
MKSHINQSCLDVFSNEGITEGYWLTEGCQLSLRTRYFNSNKCECMRAKILGMYLFKYLHHTSKIFLRKSPVESSLYLLESPGELEKNKAIKVKTHQCRSPPMTPIC